MPHSTSAFLAASLESIQQQQHQPHQPHQSQQQPPQPLSEAASESSSSSSPSLSSSSSSSPASASPLRPSSPVLSMTATAAPATSPFFRFNTLPTGKRSVSSKHMRSKSSTTPSSVGIPSLSGYSPFPTSSSRQYAPPLFRSSSLPPVSTFSEIGLRYTLTNAPPSPTARRLGPRSTSPTRQWAYSQSSLGVPRGSSSYHSGSFHPPSPTLGSQPSPPPPAYLVNEPFISSSYSSANSSSPSTPTSTRSRSPSISSLDTIPDSPDAEAEALEVEMKEALARAAAKSSEASEADEDESNGGRRRSSMDGPRDSFGVGRRGVMDKRKRWSVCGGEKRGDLELETIWEEAFGGGNNGSADPLGIMSGDGNNESASPLGITSGDGMGDGEMI